MNKLFTKIAGLSLGLAMAIGVGVGLGQSKASEAKATETTYTFTNKSWADSTSSWTSGKDGNGYTSGQGVQITSGATGANCTSKQSFTNVSEIVVSYCTNADKGKGTIKVKIGTGTEKTFSVSAPSSAGTTLKTTSFNYSPVESGAINLTVECGKNSIYINSIYVKYNIGSNYNVSFNKNGGSGEMTTISTSSPYEAPECTFGAPANKAFAYWTVGASGSEHYGVGDSITFDSDIELYANWSDAYTVSFNSNGGSGNMTSVTVASPYNAPECAFTAPANKQFAYWTVGAAGTGTHYAVGDEIALTNSITLFANWEDEPFEETLTIPGGTTTQKGSTNTTWTTSQKVSHTWVNDVHFEGLGSGANDTKYYDSDNTWRFYTAGTAGVKVTVPEGFYITEVVITFNKGTIAVPSGMTTSDSSSPITYTATGDEKASYSFCKSSNSSDNLQIKSLKVSYSATVITYPSKATAEYKLKDKFYYNGSASTSKFIPTSDLLVKTLTADNKIKDDNVLSYTLSLRKNGNEIWNNSTDTSVTFTGFEPSSSTIEYTILVTVVGVGEGGTNVQSDGTLVLTIKDKQPTENAFKFETSPVQSYVSHLDEFVIKGTLICAYTDGTGAISNELMRLDLYQGNTVSGDAIYSLVDTPETAVAERVYNVLKSDNGLVINSGLSFCGESTILKYNSETQFTYRITLLKYSSNNHFDTTVTVYPITLTAEDNSEQTYYKGGTYEMSATVTAHWNNNAGSKVLDSSLYEINGGEAFEPTEEKDDVEISVSLVNDPAKTTTYTVDVIAPSTPKHLEILLADDYKAGNKFHLGADAEVTFEGMATPQPVPYDSSELSYSLVATSTSEFDDGIEITPKSPMFLSYEGKYIIARYTMGDNHVDSDAELIEEVELATIETYTPSELGDYELVTSALTDYSGDYLIVYEGTIGTSDKIVAMPGNNAKPGNTQVYVDVSEYKTGNVIEANNNTNALAFRIENFNNGYTVKGLSSGVYIGSNSSNKNGINYTDSINDSNKNAFTNTIEFADGTMQIHGYITQTILHFNNATGSTGEMFRFYANGGQKNIKFYKRASTTPVGDVVSYLKSVIDAYRLNNELTGGLSICDAETNIYSSTDWTKAKAAFKELKADERIKLDVQDRFGEINKTYVNTYNKLISLDPSEVSNPLSSLMNIFGSSNSSTIVIIISLIGVITIGGYFYYKKRKEN